MNTIRMGLVNVLIAIIFVYWAVLWAAMFLVGLSVCFLQKLSMKLLPEEKNGE